MFAMKKIAYKQRYRQVLVEYARKHGVTKAAIRYNETRQLIYRWMRRYDGTLASLCDRSHRPNSHPSQHRPDELKLISDMRKRNRNTGLVVFWVKLCQRGYTRSITGLYRVLRRTEQMAIKLPNPKYVPKPYEQMQYPGQRVQVDVKFVPSICHVGEAEGQQFYQYTAIDEYSRYRYVEAFEEHSTYSSTVFLEHMLKAFPFEVKCVQTDNGSEFTKRLLPSGSSSPTLFERTLKQRGIQHKLIRPYTPRHNGKVERSHRKDNEYFYASHRFYSFEDFSKQLQVHNRNYNRFPMRPLGWKSPKDFLFSFLQSV